MTSTAAVVAQDVEFLGAVEALTLARYVITKAPARVDIVEAHLQDAASRVMARGYYLRRTGARSKWDMVGQLQLFGVPSAPPRPACEMCKQSHSRRRNLCWSCERKMRQTGLLKPGMRTQAWIKAFVDSLTVQERRWLLDILGVA